MKGPDLPQKRPAQFEITRRRARPDEGGPFPRERGAFIIAYRGTGRQDDRGYLGRRPEPQVDPRDIAVMSPLLQQLDEPPAISDRRLAGLVARAPWQSLGIEQQNQIYVGRIIELAASELAECENGKAPRLLVRHPLQHRSANCIVHRLVGKVGKLRRHPFQRLFVADVRQCDCQCECMTLTAQLLGNAFAAAIASARFNGRLRFPLRQSRRRCLEMLQWPTAGREHWPRRGQRLPPVSMKPVLPSAPSPMPKSTNCETAPHFKHLYKQWISKGPSCRGRKAQSGKASAGATFLPPRPDWRRRFVAPIRCPPMRANASSNSFWKSWTSRGRGSARPLRS